MFLHIEKERRRQREELVMIPSENYASRGVMRAVGSVLMNKYSEGQVGKRYYQGNANIDEVEALAKERALKLFSLDPRVWGVNVQAHSGSPANLAVYTALLEPGERIMSMFLPEGGHLSHGWHIKDRRVTLVSKIWTVEFYRVNPKTRVFDYDVIERQAVSFKPRLLISGGTAYPREIDHRRMGRIAKKVGAYYLADIAHEAGLVAAGVNSSPFPYADVVTMTTHKTLRGPRGAIILASCVKRPGASESLIEAIDRSVFPGLQGGPHNHSIAGIAVCLGEAGTAAFRGYAKQVVLNAQVLAAKLLAAGIDVVSGGTDKHLLLVDLRASDVSGWVAAWALEEVGIIVNRNTVPGETASPYYPSGIRLGTPALTTRGMKEAEMRRIAGWIVEVIRHATRWQLPESKAARVRFFKAFRKQIASDKKLQRIKRAVRMFARRYPVPG